MVLSNTAIFEALDDGRLAIVPEPAPRRPEVGGRPSPFGATSVDLTLAPTLWLPKPNLSIAVDFRDGDVPTTLQALYDKHPMDPVQGYKLKSDEFLLGITHERIELLPADEIAELGPETRAKGCLAGRVEGKSSLARFGIVVHFTAPTILNGFKGPITLEIQNRGPTSFVLYPGQAICQLIVEPVEGYPTKNPSQWDEQSGATGTKREG